MKTPLLLYLSRAGDPQRTAVGPALAAAADRAGWDFECYYDDRRSGRHFGGGDPELARPGWAAGSSVAGGGHAEHALWLATAYELVALGDPDSVLWPALEAAGAEALVRSADPAELYAAAWEHLGEPLPADVLVVDAAPQGPHAVRAAPYLYPAFLADEPALGVEVSAPAELRAALERLGARAFRGLYVARERASGFPGGLDSAEGEVGDDDYAAFTAGLAERHAEWGRGVLLGDPELVAAQLPKARRLRLLPLYGRPQTDVVEAAADAIARAVGPVFGRQYDDRDFFALARLGHGLQVLDPGPPFDAAHRLSSVREPASALPVEEPGDEELERWAREGTVLVTLLFWAGMVREVHCLPRLLDLAAELELRGGLILTADSVEHAAGSGLHLLGATRERGGVLGLLEPLLGSTGAGVAAETLLPPGTLERTLADARRRVAERLPAGLAPRGWWPLLDAPLVPHRSGRLGWRNGRPVVRFTPRGGSAVPVAAGRGRPDLRALAGAGVRRAGLERLFEERRPFDERRPGDLDKTVAEAVRAAGFSYMWSKAGFGVPRILLRRGEFVALPLTAGNWDGWSPFYTVGSPRDLARAERRLLRRREPGWVAATVDSPLWALPGEVLERGSVLYRTAELAARGGNSGRLVNVTPNVVARYARLLDDRAGTTIPAG